MGVNLRDNRHQADSLTFLRSPCSCDVVDHDASVVHRRLYSYRLTGLWVHVLAAAAVDDAIRQRLRCRDTELLYSQYYMHAKCIIMKTRLKLKATSRPSTNKKVRKR